MPQMRDDDFCRAIKQLVDEAGDFAASKAKDRKRAIEYYDGKMSDLPPQENMSGVVSRDVRANLKKVLPSIVRTILGNDRVAEFAPIDQGDVESAAQATDYINYVVFPQSDGERAVRDACFDALLFRNGVLRWWFDERVSVRMTRHSGLNEQSLNQLIADPDITPLEHSARAEVIDTPSGPQQVQLHDVKVLSKKRDGSVRLAAVPLDKFLCHPSTIDIDDSPLVGLRDRFRRSDLVAMGYDRAEIEALPIAVSGKDDEEDDRRRDANDTQAATLAMQEIDYYELYVRIDYDGDGIAELRRVVFAGGVSERNLLENDYFDEVPFADLTGENRPHQWEGDSIADDLIEVQRVKTALLRQTMDNLYWQNMPQMAVQEGAIVNPDAVFNPTFGKPIRISEGTNVREALQFMQVPFVAQSSFPMIQYFDKEAENRTGITEASAGLAPDALQNMTAKASAMLEAAGIGQTELMVRTLARGLKRVFRGLLRLVVQHQDRPRTIRLRGQWVEFDPRSWDADMDVTVNTGLGAGTRERDAMMMQQVIGLQEKIVASMGADNPYVKPDDLYNAVADFTKAIGCRTEDRYFTRPDPQEVQKQLQQAAQKPDPQMAKVQGQMQLEKVKMEAARDKEAAQMQADERIKRVEMEKTALAQRQKLEADAARDRLKIDSDERMKRLEFEHEMQMKQIELAHQVARPLLPVEVAG